MSSRLCALALLLSVCALARPAYATAETVSLHDSMERIDEAYKGLRKILRAPGNASPGEALGFVTTLKTEATRSRDLEPKTIAALPGAERAAALKAYRQQMDALLKAIGELEQAVQAGDWAQASQVARAMQRQKSEGHERFKADE
jgi:soluble cytochrome b562